MTTDRIKEIRERVEKVIGKYPIAEDFTETCECPFCHGESEVDMITMDNPKAAAGIQVFGIGEQLNDMESFAENAPTDIQFLLTELESAQAELARLTSQLADALKVTTEATIEHVKNKPR